MSCGARSAPFSMLFWRFSSSGESRLVFPFSLYQLPFLTFPPKAFTPGDDFLPTVLFYHSGGRRATFFYSSRVETGRAFHGVLSGALPLSRKSPRHPHPMGDRRGDFPFITTFVSAGDFCDTGRTFLWPRKRILSLEQAKHTEQYGGHAAGPPREQS